MKWKPETKLVLWPNINFMEKNQTIFFGSCGLMILFVIGYNTINIPDRF